MILTSQEQVARELGLGVRTIREYVARGLPHESRAYDTAVIVPWCRDHIWKRLAAAPSEKSEALERYRAARAEREEMALAREQGRTINTNELHDLLNGLAAILRNAGLEIGRSHPAAQEILTEAINDFERRVRRYFTEDQEDDPE